MVVSKLDVAQEVKRVDSLQLSVECSSRGWEQPRFSWKQRDVKRVGSCSPGCKYRTSVSVPGFTLECFQLLVVYCVCYFGFELHLYVNENKLEMATGCG